ncbi:hypothetical protein CUMW_006060 [Citrus unshiu]|nr:hypothetical protein CUMW_006060 [Citrus unshiu]
MDRVMANENSHGSGVVLGSSTNPAKLIIDTDPGIDDSMTILMAFQTPELEILGLTTIFGNVTTEDATRNALTLVVFFVLEYIHDQFPVFDMQKDSVKWQGVQICIMSAGQDFLSSFFELFFLQVIWHPLVIVAKVTVVFLEKGGQPRVAEFAHGSDGMGNISLTPPKAKQCDKNASEFLVDKVSEYPGEVSILALGPLTNLALAIKRDSSFASKVKNIVVLGGAFFALGNVNPAAEANIYGDPEAADVVFTSGANIAVVGINITTQVKLTDADFLELRQSKGRYVQLLGDMCKFYRDWHVKSDGVHGIFLHDPVSFVALVRPDLFTFKKGVVRVETQGICTGHTLMDQGLKRWNVSNPWTGYSPVSVAWTVNVDKVLNYIKRLLMKQ